MDIFAGHLRASSSPPHPASSPPVNSTVAEQWLQMRFSFSPPLWCRTEKGAVQTPFHTDSFRDGLQGMIERSSPSSSPSKPRKEPLPRCFDRQLVAHYGVLAQRKP